MKPEAIQKTVLAPGSLPPGSTRLLPEEIPGATPVLHVLKQGTEMELAASETTLRVLFLLNGSAVFAAKDATIAYTEPAVFAHRPQEKITITAQTDAAVLEIEWQLTGEEAGLLLASRNLPFTQTYAASQQYRDPFKSEKTISRAIVPHRVLPRFAMGSVETHGTDLVGQHAHPLLDQFFFSMPENNCILLIDSMQYPMKGNTLLHIPLGSNHGVFTGPEHCAHYLWVDFIPDESGLVYLDQVHKPV